MLSGQQLHRMDVSISIANTLLNRRRFLNGLQKLGALPPMNDLLMSLFVSRLHSSEVMNLLSLSSSRNTLECDLDYLLMKRARELHLNYSFKSTFVGGRSRRERL